MQQDKIFIDQMLDTPLCMYLDTNVPNRHQIANLIVKHGGLVANGYSGAVPYILVDPYTRSGQSLFRQWSGKKGRIVLSYRWIHKCIQAQALQTLHMKYAGCKVTGEEEPPESESERDSDDSVHEPQPVNLQDAPQHANQHHQMVPVSFPYPVYAQPGWQTMSSFTPQPQLRSHYPSDTWNSYSIPQQVVQTGYEYHTAQWVPGPVSTGEYYHVQNYDQIYPHQTQYIEPVQQPPQPEPIHQQEEPIQEPERPPQVQLEPSPVNVAGPSSTEIPEKTRGRKRHRTQPKPAAPASSLVLTRNANLTRSPSPPTKVVKSTYGGNLFTSDDINYLKRYIDYCQDQGLVLSLREICERIAVKAPHHTFYSWRRYCNKHQIRLGGYAMNAERSPSPDQYGQLQESELSNSLEASGVIQRINYNPRPRRQRSPTPPKALFRSTAGKGVAFTTEDITFLVKYLNYRKAQGMLDMISFWKDVAEKAPHHSRASWMKFWRRHKHELERSEVDDPLPRPPDKKMRYSSDDDILLAKYFFAKPDGTSDLVFQAFGRQYPNHPWKGWQEHYRLKKAKIDDMIARLAKGEILEADGAIPDTVVAHGRS